MASRKDIFMKILGIKKMKEINYICHKYANNYYKKSSNLEKGKDFQKNLKILRDEKVSYIERLIRKDSPEFSQDILNNIKNLPREKLIKYMTKAFLDKKYWEPFKLALKKKNVKIKRIANSCIPCGRCKSEETMVDVSQTRGSDEGMTSFFTCLNCNHRWKH